MATKGRAKKIAAGVVAAGAVLGAAGAFLQTKKGKELQKDVLAKGKKLQKDAVEKGRALSEQFGVEFKRGCDCCENGIHKAAVIAKKSVQRGVRQLKKTENIVRAAAKKKK